MFDSPIGGLSSRSKKIQKSNPSPVQTDCSTKKYKTFDNLQKEQVLSDLRTGVISLLKIDPHHEALYTQDLLGLLAEIGIDDYNKLIKNIFSKQFENFDLSSKGYTQWRKKIKNWILNLGKPETRGGLVVPINKIGAFRTRVMEIVQSLTFKCFNELKDKILKILEEYHNQSQDSENPQPFNEKTCSKHWWFNFMAKNQDIKEMWDSLPLTAKAARLRARAMSQASTHEDTASMGYLSDTASPAYQGFSGEDRFWVEPSLKDLSAVYESSEAYLKSLCIAFENFEEEPYQQSACSIALMEEEKVLDSMFSFGEEARCSKNRSSAFALIDEDKVEFERENNDTVGQMFSQMFIKNNTTFNQDSSRAENFFSLFRTQEFEH